MGPYEGDLYKVQWEQGEGAFQSLGGSLGRLYRKDYLC